MEVIKKIKDNIRLYFLKNFNYKITLKIWKEKWNWSSLEIYDLHESLKKTNKLHKEKNITKFDENIYNDIQKYKKAVSESLVCLDTKGMKDALDSETLYKGVTNNFIKEC